MAFLRNFFTCKKKPLTCSSLLARSILLSARLCQICGCFFVRDIFSGAQKQARKVRWRSWYTIYSCACASFVAWIGFDTLASWTVEWYGHRENVDNNLHIVIHAMLLLRVTVNFLCMLWGSTNLASVYKRASAYENRTGMAPCECCSTWKIFWYDTRRFCVWVLYCIATAITDPSGQGEVTSALTQTLYWMQTFLWLVYDTMYSVALQQSGQALCQYLDHELQSLTLFTGAIGLNQRAYVARCIEEVRLNVFTVIELKRDINDIWVFSILISALFVLLVPCICVYEACYATYDPEQRSFVILYAVYTAYDFATLTHVSQSMINRVKLIKDACMAVRSAENRVVHYQIQRLHDSINPDDMAIKGGDFFTLDMSALVSMAASVISYAVILEQTTQALKKPRDTTAWQFSK
ncbi:hypothetical protein MRX96_021671 [Rhipicephalus microplus]